MDVQAPWWRWFKRVFIGLLVVANLGALYTIYKIDDVEDTFVEVVDTVPMVEEVLDVAPEDPKDPLNLLFLGSDSRDNLPDEWLDDFGDFAGQRADVIMMVRLEPETGIVRVLSIPRDLRVEIEGYGPQKINAAYAFGGAPLMVSTVRAVTGLPIHHYVEIDFVGFTGLVDELGGVKIDFAYPARDLKSGLQVEGGTQTLDGRMALAYARSRSFQENQDGRWVSVDAGDIGRTGRQQELLLAIFSKLKTPSAIADPTSIVRALGDFMDVDPNFLKIDLFDLALAFRSLGGSDIETATLPTTSERIDGIFYEILVQPDAAGMLAAFASPGATLSAGPAPAQAAGGTTTTSAALDPGNIRVVVENGNGAVGAASAMAERLEQLGFLIVSVGDAESFDYDITEVIAGGRDDIASLVLDGLGFGEAVAGSVPEGSDVLVIVGADT